MPDMGFQVESARLHHGALTPHLLFRLRLTESTETPVHAIVLRCQVHVEPVRRRYTGNEQDRLLDLFDTPDRWGQTLRPLLWTHVQAIVPPFVGDTSIELPVPCSYDFDLAANKYFDALDEGAIPLCFLCSGTIFYETGGRLQVAPIPWAKESSFLLSVGLWKELMNRYYSDSSWIRLRKDLFDRLGRYRSCRGLPTWDRALEDLLATAQEPVKS